VNVILFVVATKLTTAANAILLQYTAPVYVAIFSGIFLSERIKKLDWFVIFMVMSGMYLFFLDELSTGNLLGNLLAILGGLFFAFYIIFMRKQKSGFPLGSTLLGNIIAAFCTIPFMFGPAPNASGWVGLILLGVIQLGLSHVLYSVAIRKVSALKSIMIPMVEPILNPVWVFLLLGERPGFWAMVGGIIVVAAVAWHSVIIQTSRRSG